MDIIKSTKFSPKIRVANKIRNYTIIYNENRKRKSTINVKRVKGLKDEGLNNSEIAAHMGISRMSGYRSLNS